MATTTNFGWTTPDDTALVKDGASAIRTLGSSIDTSMAQLKGGTTGQVLSKTSNTDMAFTWVTQDDANAIQNTIVDAKGDLISATGNDVPARLAVGTNGQILTADSTTSTGLKWANAGGGMTLLSTTTLSGSTTSLTSISGAYTNLVLYLVNFYASSATTLNLQVNSVTSGYLGITNYNSATVTGNDAANTTSIRPTNINFFRTVDDQNFSCIVFPLYSNSTGRRLAVTNTTYVASSHSGSVAEQVVYYCGLNSAITQIDIKTGSGTWSGGTAFLYGVK